MLREILIPPVIFLFCLTMFATLALAGTQLSPFKPKINKLNAIEESLNALGDVQNSAQFLSDNATIYMNQSMRCGACKELATQSACEGETGCYWIDAGICCDHS